MATPIARFPRRTLLGLIPLMCVEPVLAAARAQTLFTIARSKNRNVIHYDAQIERSGKLQADHPITAYWILKAEDGRREELTWLEASLAYGFDVSLDTSRERATLRLKACSERPIRIRAAGSRYEAIMPIQRRSARLREVYVKSSEGGLIPGVEYIDIKGVDLETGKVLSERLRNG